MTQGTGLDVHCMITTCCRVEREKLYLKRQAVSVQDHVQNTGQPNGCVWRATIYRKVLFASGHLAHILVHTALES